ncbi:hypothetical protein BH10PSE3_BH10PSE3_32300 [soil metagenome]
MIEFDDAPKGLARLIYASLSTQSGLSAFAERVRAITVESIHNNRLANITGFLVFGGDRFLQLLEGPVHEVEATFARVARDTRHTDVTVIAQGDAERRLFRDWNMAQHQIGAADQALLSEAGLSAFVPEGLSRERALHLLTTLGGRYLR